MPKDTKKKANPALEDDELDEQDELETETDEETETDAEAEDEGTDEEEEVEEKPKAKAKGAAKSAKSTTKGKAKAKPAVEEDEEMSDEEAEAGAAPQRDVAKPRTRNSIEAEMHSDIESTKRALAKEPKVRIFIPLGIGEKKGSKSAVESVTINGYRQVLPKGEYLTVAQSVADQIEQHYNMTPESTEMGQAYRLDRPRFKDGMSTDEALS